jgi:hypothetical protein
MATATIQEIHDLFHVWSEAPSLDQRMELDIALAQAYAGRAQKALAAQRRTTKDRREAVALSHAQNGRYGSDNHSQ